MSLLCFTELFMFCLPQVKESLKMPNISALLLLTCEWQVLKTNHTQLLIPLPA